MIKKKHWKTYLSIEKFIKHFSNTQIWIIIKKEQNHKRKIITQSPPLTPKRKNLINYNKQLFSKANENNRKFINKNKKKNGKEEKKQHIIKTKNKNKMNNVKS